MTTAAIIQSSYIPWRGYFDIINDVDIFVFLDDVQMTKRDWRSRNKIKTARGTEWLTVPTMGGRSQRIDEVQTADAKWPANHLKSIRLNYAKAPYLVALQDLLASIYSTEQQGLSEMNQNAIRIIASYLGVQTELISSTEINVSGTKDDRLIAICRAVGATVYLSGPSAKDYIVNDKFDRAGIELRYKSYNGYPEYPQLHGPFEPYVTVIDLLLNCGPDSARYIWGWRSS